MKETLRNWVITLLIAAVTGFWWWGLATLSAYQIASTAYSLYWIDYVETLSRFTWIFWVRKQAGSEAFWSR